MSSVLVLGGDGFCGWPAALHLSALGHEVTIVDNLSRRDIDIELQTSSLTPIRTLPERLEAWRALTGRTIDFEKLTLGADYDRLVALIRGRRPATILHFAEQRSAPYSMLDSRHRRLTVANNVQSCHDVVSAIAESGQDVHLIHLGTMGVYGYKPLARAIPDGYLSVTVEDSPHNGPLRILHPTDPGSVYHMTKVQDQITFAFYNKNYGLKITDLHQGIIWGTQTDETALDERLINRFDYDGNFGTVLNRFLMQAAIGHKLTVYGTGRQMRAFIHIRDMVRCVELAAATPPEQGAPVRILNQVTETHRVRNLAEKVSRIYGVAFETLENPRLEAAENELAVSNIGLMALGLRPTTLDEALLDEVTGIAEKYAHRCDPARILTSGNWRTR